MSEAKNEGLEVVAVVRPMTIYASKMMNSGEKLCRHSEAIAGYAVRDARISALEFELDVAKTDELSAAVWAATETIKHDLWDAQAEIVKRDARIATQEAQIKALQSDANSWQSGYDEGRRMGAKHCIGTIDQLRAELSAAKETIMRYETTAENCDLLRADHLASHAYDEAKERALFEAEHSAFRLARNGFGVYEVDFVSGLWFGWSACAKSRAKAAGCL